MPPDQREGILFVDDNTELRQFLRDTLQFRYQIYEAEAGNAGFEMARQISKTRLSQKIKSIMEQSIVEFICTFRLKRSVQIMTQEAIPLNEVPYRVGFQDPSYFSKVFRKEFGKLPSLFLESLSSSRLTKGSL